MLIYYIGDVCQVGKGNSRNHVCKQPENCTSLEQQLRNQDFPHVCSFIKNMPIVCCSPTVTTNTTNFEPVLKNPISTSSYSASESTYRWVYRKFVFKQLFINYNRSRDRCAVCRQYSELVYANVQQSSSGERPPRKTLKCYNVMTLIVGGMKAKPMEFPHMV